MSWTLSIIIIPAIIILYSIPFWIISYMFLSEFLAIWY